MNTYKLASESGIGARGWEGGFTTRTGGGGGRGGGGDEGGKIITPLAGGLAYC